MTSTYDPQNIFVKIMNGELPCFKVYEDVNCFAFMDINPRAAGHCLVIPKSAARNLLDISDDALAKVHAVSKKIAKAQMAAFQADGISVFQSNEAAGGQEVFHYHVHVVPRHEGIKMSPPGKLGDMDEIKANAEKIVAALA